MATVFALDEEMLDIEPLDGEPAAASEPADEIWYNYFGLQNSAIISEILLVSAPNLELTQRGFPRADGVYAESAQFRQNRIMVRGSILKSSRTLLETAMDDMREAFAVYGGTLRFSWAGAARYFDDCYPVSLDGLFKGREHYHVDWCPFEMEFTSQHPYARDGSRVLLDISGTHTTSPINFTVANAGTAKTDPIVTVSVVTAGALTALAIENMENDEIITITRAWANGDTLEVNGEEKTVKVNGTAVDYTGVIPKANAGDNAFQVTATGSGYTIGISEKHYNRYH